MQCPGVSEADETKTAEDVCSQVIVEWVLTCFAAGELSSDQSVAKWSAAE